MRTPQYKKFGQLHQRSLMLHCLMLSLIMEVENTNDGVKNECSDLDKVVEDIKEIIILAWIQYSKNEDFS